MNIYKFFTPLLFLILISCGEDDDSLSNKIVIDGESIPLINGYYFDIEREEPVVGRIQHGTHYAQAFLLTDGILTVSVGELVCTNCTFQVFIDASSAGVDAFTSDDFNSEDPSTTQLTSTAAESFLYMTAESTDGSTHYTSAPGGTVSIEVNIPTFTFTFDLSANDLSDGAANSSIVKILGRFKGVFEEMDASLLGAEH